MGCTCISKAEKKRLGITLVWITGIVRKFERSYLKAVKIWSSILKEAATT